MTALHSEFDDRVKIHEDADEMARLLISGRYSI